MAPDDEAAQRLEQFWLLARQHLRLNPLPAYFGQSSAEAMPPPAWAFGDDPEMADDLVARVLSGAKTATAGALRDYQAHDEPIPQVGDVSIILDGRGDPRALIVVTDVAVERFGDVDAEHARLEGEGDLSLEYWRDAHRDFFARTWNGDEPVTDDLDVVLERFEVAYRAGKEATGQ